MSIFENLKKAHAAVVADSLKPTPTLGFAIGNLAIEAIKGGIQSQAWTDYMSLFANNAKELERLKKEDAGEPNYLAKYRAYIVSNGVCDVSTNTYTNNRVEADIDAGFTPADMTPDPVFIQNRKVKIPDVTSG